MVPLPPLNVTHGFIKVGKTIWSWMVLPKCLNIRPMKLISNRLIYKCFTWNSNEIHIDLISSVWLNRLAFLHLTMVRIDVSLTIFGFGIVQLLPNIDQCVRLHLGHDFQIFECIAGSISLGRFRCLARSLANGYRQCWQLDQALKLSRIRFLIDINVSDFELLFSGDLLQELNEIDGLVSQTSFLRKQKRQMGRN